MYCTKLFYDTVTLYVLSGPKLNCNDYQTFKSSFEAKELENFGLTWCKLWQITQFLGIFCLRFSTAKHLRICKLMRDYHISPEQNIAGYIFLPWCQFKFFLNWFLVGRLSTHGSLWNRLRPHSKIQFQSFLLILFLF